MDAGTATTSQHLPQAFFARPVELVASELKACLLIKNLKLNLVALYVLLVLNIELNGVSSVVVS